MAESGEKAADQLLEILENSGCDTLNIRVHVAGIDQDQIRDQLITHSGTLVPLLKLGLKSS